MSVEDLRKGFVSAEAITATQLAAEIDQLIIASGPHTVGVVMSALLTLLSQGFAKIHINDGDEEIEKVMSQAFEDVRLGEKINYEQMKPRVETLRLLSNPGSGGLQ